MFAPNRILAAVDFSDASRAALRRAADLARRADADLHVLHVVPGLDEAAYGDLPPKEQAFYRPLWERAEPEMRKMLRSVGVDAATSALSFGPASREILAYADCEGADLVVVGTAGRRGLRRFFLGSVAGEVLRRTELPVMVVPESSAERDARRLVLAPTDFSKASRLALPLAAGLAGAYGADLDLLYAVEPVPLLEAMTGAEAAAGVLPELHAEAERHLRALAEEPALAEALAGDDAPAEAGGRVLARIGYRLVEGRAAEAIVDAARSSGADAVVMAKQGLHGVERFLIGSVTERVCRLAPCAVLVVPVT